VDNDEEKRKKRRSKRHSDAFDDTQSVTSSPARIDESRERRHSRDPSLSKEKENEKEKDQDKDKKSGGFFSNLFGSKSNTDLSSSSSAKREVRSEVGVDDYNKSERRRKKRSSGGLDTASEGARSSLDLSQLDKAEEGDGGDNDSQVSRRRRKRRDKYEEIVESSRDASAKVDF
jgi:hypothetical protein